MRHLHLGLARADEYVTAWVTQHGVTVLRISVGIIFFWFGVLKVFPRLSPAEDLAARTIAALSLGYVPAAVSVPVLAAWECLIGFSPITGLFLRPALLLMFAHMSGTITPFVLFPQETWAHVPYAATFEGQYIIKNMVLVSAALVVYPLSAAPCRSKNQRRRGRGYLSRSPRSPVCRMPAAAHACGSGTDRLVLIPSPRVSPCRCQNRGDIQCAREGATGDVTNASLPRAAPARRSTR